MELKHDMITHGVTVVTAAFEGRRGGLAVAWATQCSTDHLVICVGSQSSTRPLILGSGAFGCCILGKDQLDLSRRFGSGSSSEIDKFEGIAVHAGLTGAPLLDDCVWALECRVRDTHVTDGALIIVGEVIGAERRRPVDAERLTYRESDY